MAGFRVLKARAAPLDMANVDTDRIIPARFLKQRRGAAYSGFLFHDCRFAPDGRRIDAFPLNQPAYASARILVADANFGIGSAREGAVWALQEFGIEAVVAAGFGDVFRANCVKNVVLPVSLGHGETIRLRQQLLDAPGSELTIDLPSQTVTAPDGAAFPFSIDPFEKRMLIEGLDEIAITTGYMQAVEVFERSYFLSRPWLQRR